LADFLTDRTFRNDGYGLLGLNRRLDGLDVFQFHNIGDAHAVLAKDFIEVLACWNVRTQSHEALSLKLVELNGAFSRKRMSRRRDQNQPFLPAGDGSKSGACFRISDKSEIGMAVDHGIINFLSFAIVDRDFHARMGFPKLFENGGEIMKGDADDAGQTELPFEFFTGDPEARTEAVEALQDIAAGFEIDAPFRCQGEEVSGAINEGNAELFFHGPDLLTYRALADSAGLGSPGEVTSIAQITEDLETLYVHAAEFIRARFPETKGKF